MRRFQILMDEALDDALERRARAERVSKAALIRRYVGEKLNRLPPLSSDPLWRMAGTDDFESSPINDVVYR